MWRKVDRHFTSCRIAQLFLDLRRMAMRCNSVCLHIFIDFAKQIWHLCSASRTGSTTFGIYDQRRRIDQAFLYQWICRENRTSRITSRIGDQTRCLCHLITIDLAQSVNRFFDQLRGLMLDLVPLLIDIDIFDPIVCGQINKFCLRKQLLI